MATKTVADVDVAGKTVLMRVDFNVPLEKGKITNDRRIVQALPTIEYVLDRGAKLVLMSHCGRPAGKGYEAEFSNKPAAERLSQLLGKPVKLGDGDVGGPADQKAVAAMKSGQVILLENVRFNAGEDIIEKAKKNPDKKLTPEQEARQKAFTDILAKLPADVYVNDAFGTCHREHVSMYHVAKAIKARGGPAVAGFLVEKEIKYLDEALKNPKRPFVAVLGGAKVSDKIKLISKLLGKVDTILIGGAMAYTLLKAKGVKVGKSFIDPGFPEADARALLGKAGAKIMLPCDHVASDFFDPKEMKAGKPAPVNDVNIPDGLLGLDIGGRTVAEYGKVLAKAGTIVWNGPMGVCEISDYANGTNAMAKEIAGATEKGAISIVGGGDSVGAVEKTGLEKKMTHVSTGGGAALEYMEGKRMPPLEVLDRR